MKKVLVGMSGGVDSTVSCLLLQKQGYEVVGVSFRFTEDFDDSDAKKVAAKLNIEHHTIDYRSEFKKIIIDKFLDDYSNGLTPNPCVHCNINCKFKFLFDNMNKFNCDYIATGHYAKIEDNKLKKSVDKNKDQTYFLYGIPKEMISKIKFPLDGIPKTKVREIAKENGFFNHNKKDSFDVCFITESFKEYMKKNINSNPGDVILIDNNEVIGKHEGLNNYTIGQRRGLNIGGYDDRMFVVGKDTDKNILYVSIGDDSDYLISTSCVVSNVNLLVDDKFDKCNAKFRYRSDEVEVTVDWENDNEVIVYYEGLKRITPGQACVFYDGDICLGGGIITEVRKDDKKLWYV